MAAAAGARAARADVERELAVDGATRSYVIHVPGAWNGKSAIPVLLVFHGAGSDAESMVRATGFDDAAERTPMLVAYPRAPARVLRYEVDPPAGRESADVLFVDALLERLRARFPVDERRIWATGFSNGAAFCYRLAAERPRVVAAIAPVAGYLPRLSTEPGDDPVPLLHVHGTADGRVSVPTFGERESPVAAWARRNGATEGPTLDAFPEADRFSIRRATWRGRTPRADAVLLLVEGEGHTWSGGAGGPVSRAVLAFLSAHPKEAAMPRDGAAHPLVGRPFGALDALRGDGAEGRPAPLATRPLTLLRWWTNGCPHCAASLPAIAALDAKYRARGLRVVAVYHPKGAPLADPAARETARSLGFTGEVAFDDRWTKYADLRDRGDLRAATSISLLVDAAGTIRWVHPGPRLEPGSADVAALDALLDRTLPP